MIDSAEKLDRRGSPLPTDTHPNRALEPAEDALAGRLMFQGRAWWALAIVSVVSDFAMFPMLTPAKGQPHLGFSFGVAAVGCTLAQGSLLAAWLAWGDGPFLRRLMRHWVVAGAMCGIWLVGLGLSVSRPQEFIEVGLNVALTVPLVSLGAQLPLWIVRQLFGWRLVRRAGNEQATAEPPLAIRDLMAATVIVAVSFAVARLAPEFQKEMFWIACIALAISAGVSALVMLPAAAILLRPRELIRAIVYIGLLAAVPISIIWLSVAIAWWYAPRFLAPCAVYVLLTVMMLSFAGTLVLAAVAAREQGYWLVWGR